MFHEVRVRSFSSLRRKLEAHALGAQSSEFVFRGHMDSRWGLNSTFARYIGSRSEFHSLAIQQMTERMSFGLRSLGETAMNDMSTRGKLEYARHYGLPSPLIDFSYSPYVAIWFGFNGIRGSQSANTTAIYALNWNLLGVCWERFLASSGRKESYAARYGKPPMDVFRWELPSYFDDGPVTDDLKFLAKPASWNTRAQRQMGCFLYDTVDYERAGIRGLEELVSRFGLTNTGPVITKYIIPHSCAREVFDTLDLLAINGSRLMDDISGVVCDVYNAYNHNPRARSWD